MIGVRKKGVTTDVPVKLIIEPFFPRTNEERIHFHPEGK
jgi:hypothetical protein